MNIHVLGMTMPGTHYGLMTDRAIKKYDKSAPGGRPEGGPVWAHVSPLAVIGGEGLKMAGSSDSHGQPSVPRVVVDAGSMPGAGTVVGVRAGDEVGSGWRTWGPAGRAMFDAACDRLAGACMAAGVTLVVHPGVGQALSDIPSCLTFLRRYESAPFELMVEPTALLSESMLPRAAEHLERIGEAFVGHPKVSAVMLTNAVVEREGLRSVRVDGGEIAAGVVRAMAQRVGEGRLVLFDVGVDRQIEFLLD